VTVYQIRISFPPPRYAALKTQHSSNSCGNWKFVYVRCDSKWEGTGRCEHEIY